MNALSAETEREEIKMKRRTSDNTALSNPRQALRELTTTELTAVVGGPLGSGYVEQ